MAQEYFSLERAKGLLPWLADALKAISALYAQVVQLQEEVLAQMRRGQTNGGSATERELGAKRKALEAAAADLEKRIAEVTSKSIILRDPERGLVDFLSWREGREVYLCWLPGESEIGYWHELEAGFAGRQRL